MRKFVGIRELPRRGLAVLAGVIALAFLTAWSVMAYQAPAVPDGVKVAMGVLALTVIALALVLLFPRTYLHVDVEKRIATFVDRGTRSTLPLDEVGPLFVRKITRNIGNSAQRSDATYTFRIESAAFPVAFYVGSTKKSAQRRLKKLNEQLGFSRTAPPKESYEHVNDQLR